MNVPRNILGRIFEKNVGEYYIGFIWIYLYQNVSFLPSFGTHIFSIKLKNILFLVFYTRDTQANIREEREIFLASIVLDLFGFIWIKILT